jgi:hypothetical protein
LLQASSVVALVLPIGYDTPKEEDSRAPGAHRFSLKRGGRL